MARKHNVKEIALAIEDVIPFKNEIASGFTIEWSSTIGWGEYTLYRNEDGKWYGDAETMDINEDKEFITELMRLFVEQLQIV